MTPFFSIIIPVYNVAPYLRECLESILAQTFTDWEAICVDDGSTDDSGAILNEFQKKDGRIRVVHQENRGVSASRNLGISLANGQYLTFCDSDDRYAPQWLEAAYEAIQKTAADMVRMRFFLGDEYGEGENNKIPPMDKLPVIAGRNEVLAWAWTELLRGGWSSLLFIGRPAFNESAMFPVGMQMKEDNIFCLKIAKDVNSVCQLDYRGYWYRQRETSAIHQIRPLGDTLRFFEELIAQAKSVVSDCRKDVSRLIMKQTNRFLMEDLAGYIAAHGHIPGEERNTLLQTIATARQKGCLRIFSTPKAWCLPLIFLTAFKSFWGFPINTLLVRAYAQMRAGLKGCRGSK